MMTIASGGIRSVSRLVNTISRLLSLVIALIPIHSTNISATSSAAEVITQEEIRSGGQGVNGTCDNLNALNWISGRWQTTSSDKLVTEIWQRTDLNLYVGLGKTKDLISGKSLFVEHMRILKMSDGIFYLAKTPENPLPIAFKLVTCRSDYLLFKNSAHDFPQLIEYSKHSRSRLNVRVWSEQNSGFRLNLTRMNES